MYIIYLLTYLLTASEDNFQPKPKVQTMLNPHRTVLIAIFQLYPGDLASCSLRYLKYIVLNREHCLMLNKE